jgi:hypothetical protein
VITAVDAAQRRVTVRFPGTGGGGSGGDGSGSGGGEGSKTDGEGSDAAAPPSPGGLDIGSLLRKGLTSSAPSKAGTLSSSSSDAAAAAAAAGAEARIVMYTGREIAEQLQLAWATTVHKAQGSEFPAVVLALHGAFGQMLMSRPALYTAVTRARRMLVVVASSSALAAAAQREGGGAGKLTALGARLVDAGRAAGLEPVAPLIFDGGEGGGEGPDCSIE